MAFLQKNSLSSASAVSVLCGTRYGGSYFVGAFKPGRSKGGRGSPDCFEPVRGDISGDPIRSLHTGRDFGHRAYGKKGNKRAAAGWK